MTILVEGSGPELHYSYPEALCSATVRKMSPLASGISRETITLENDRGQSGTIIVPHEGHVLMANRSGTLVLRENKSPKVRIIPADALTFVAGGSEIIVHIAKGFHRMECVTWHEMQTPSINHLLGVFNRSIASQPIHPHLSRANERFKFIEEIDPTLGESLVLSAILESVAVLFSGPETIQLAPVPVDLAEPLKGLVQKVAINPVQAWPLREAAEMAGYSPFHFSRVFKQAVGIGFHEFVDRHRTALAAELLANSQASVEEVAVRSGFGTSQGLRGSLKDHLGLVPSEIRGIPMLAPKY